MPEDLVADCNTLITLLRSQREALEAGDSQKCTALLPLITQYRQRITAQPDRLRCLSTQETSLWETLAREIEACRSGWASRRETLEQARQQLWSMKSLAQNMAPPRQRTARVLDQRG